VSDTTVAQRPVSPVWVLVPFVAGAAVAVALGVYGNTHDATGQTVFAWIFSGQLQLKVWFATVAFALAIFQLLSAMRMYGTLTFPRTMPGWYPQAHRLSGTLALIFTLPVGYHCLWSIGFQDPDARVMLHSLFGCLFYGAFVAKVIVVRDHRLPGWMLPFVGAVTFTALVVLFFTSSLWYFTTGADGRPIF
jgi:hypothetical protein